MADKPTTSSQETIRTCKMNGQVIRSLGIQKFIDNCNKVSTANVDFFATKQLIEKRWHECDMGCHGPSYRVLSRQTNYSEVMDTLEKFDPTKGAATGTLDGAITTASRIVKGTHRSGEGLGLAGKQRISEIGTENSVAFDLAKDALVKAFTLSLSVVDNPFTSLIIRILTHYIKFIPDEIIVELAISGKLKLNEIEIDVHLAIQASKKGLTEIDVTDIAIDELREVAAYLKNNPQMLNRFIGKRIGNYLATYIATIIAVEIAKNIAIYLARTRRYQKTLKQYKPGKSAKNLAGILVFLLKTQGMLQEASNASRRLSNKSPQLWQSLRNMNGLDMIYFFVEDYLTEYIDRIALGEKHPTRFVEMVVAILEPPGTAKDLFFPHK